MIAIPKIMAELTTVNCFRLTLKIFSGINELRRKISTINNCPASSPTLNAKRGCSKEASFPSKALR